MSDSAAHCSNFSGPLVMTRALASGLDGLLLKSSALCFVVISAGNLQIGLESYILCLNFVTCFHVNKYTLVKGELLVLHN